MRALVVLVLLFSFNVKAQLYKADFVSTKEYEKFVVIGKDAYLDYNLDKMYTELIFNDSVYHYSIKKTGKPLDKKRFVVSFTDSKDTMLWNLSKEGDYIFAFSIDGSLYWFRSLSNPLREEYDWVRRKSINR